MKAQIATIKVMDRMNNQSASRSNRFIFDAVGALNAVYDNNDVVRNSTASSARRSSAIVSALPRVMTTRTSPMTVRQTPTIPAETEKMWIQMFSSRRELLMLLLLSCGVIALVQ